MSQFDTIPGLGATMVLLLGVASGYGRNRLWIAEPAICLARCPRKPPQPAPAGAFRVTGT